MIPISDVYLYEDRAQIARKGSIELKAGNNTIVLKELSPLIVLKSVQVMLGDLKAKVNFVETKLYQKEDTKPDFTKPKDSDERFSLEEDAARDEKRKAHILETYQKMYAQNIKEMFLDVSRARGSREDWERKEKLLRQKKEQATQDYLQAHLHYEKIRRENQEHNIHSSSVKKYRRFTSMKIDIFVEHDQELDISIGYLLPNACWRPSHRMELLTDKAHFDIGAMIWQNTGVDWENVQLFFSTERSSLGKQVPALQPDILSLQSSEKSVYITEREQDVHQVGGTVIKESSMPGIDAGGGNSKPVKACDFAK